MSNNTSPSNRVVDKSLDDIYQDLLCDRHIMEKIKRAHSLIESCADDDGIVNKIDLQNEIDYQLNNIVSETLEHSIDIVFDECFDIIKKYNTMDEEEFINALAESNDPTLIDIIFNPTDNMKQAANLLSEI